MSILTREDILGLNDIETKAITIPDHIPGWGGKSIYIRQLTRGQQDEYLRRQFGSIKMKQDTRAKQQELTSATMFGHDAWICVRGIVDANGKAIFADADITKLNEKNGEAVGWIAKQIVEFSGMKEEDDELKEMEKAEGELKN